MMKFTKIIPTFLLSVLLYTAHQINGRSDIDIIDENYNFTSNFQKLQDISYEERTDHRNYFPKELNKKFAALKPFDFQVAGNKGEKQGKRFGMSKDIDGHVLKGSPTKMEQNFYLHLQQASDSDPILKELKRFIPEFYGIRNIKFEDTENTYVCLEDITRNFLLPSVMDVKIGERTWGPTETEEKIKKRKAKFVEMRKHYGFCIPGARYCKFHGGKSEKLRRPYTDNMTPAQGIEVLYKFVNGKFGLKHRLVVKILEQLREIRSWFERQRHYNFYGSSILIAYDSASLKKNNPKVRVRMIDFSQAVPSTDKDENYARGLGNLIKLFENLETAVRRYTNIVRTKGIANATIETSDGKVLGKTSTHLIIPADFQKKFNIVSYHSLITTNSTLETLGILILMLQSINYETDFKTSFLKPDINKEEDNFYKTLWMNLDPVIAELRQFIPSYRGKLKIKAKGRVWDILRLENFMNGFELPCFTYVTIGSQTRPVWAPQELNGKNFEINEILQEREFDVREVRYHTVRGLGTSEEPIWKKASGSNSFIQPDEALYNFINGEIGIKYGVVDNILYKLRQLESWFERQRFFRFYQSSLVLFYDARDLHDILVSPINDRRGLNVPVKILLLDFDNVFVDTEDEPDENCLNALRNLIDAFQNMSTNTFEAPDRENFAINRDHFHISVGK